MLALLKCAKCKLEQEESEFWLKSKNSGVYRTWCKSCCRRASRRVHLRVKYGLTEDDYQLLLEEQEGRCAICGVASDKLLHVDHSHTTGKIRALLCYPCNALLGFAHEDSSVLLKAIQYLAKYGDD